MTIKVFISSNRAEFIEEREFLLNEIKKDASLKNLFDVFVFEKDKAKTISAEEYFINQAQDADIYIGLIGSNYGKIYKDNISSTEYEYNVYSSMKNDSYFFVKKVDERDEGSQKFYERIRKNKTYKSFKTKEELLIYVKDALNDYLEKILSNKSFDEKIIRNSSFDDVDEEAIESFFNILSDDALEQLKDRRSNEKILEYIGAGEIDINGIFHLNNAGALFFAKNLDKFDIDHEVKMVRFNGNDRVNITDRLITNKSIFILIKEFERFFKNNTKLGFIVNDFERIDIPEYPISAVREALINALAHRNYKMVGNCITFYIYDDRIEIISPGNLPYPLTIEKLGISMNPIHRNKNIYNIFSKTKCMEHVGTGINRMNISMINSGLPKPEFYNDGGFFTVILRGPNGKLITPTLNEEAFINNLSEHNLNQRQINAMLKFYNSEDIEFSYDSYSKYFNISKSTSKRDLNDLFNKKLINKKTTNRQKIFYINH